MTITPSKLRGNLYRLLDQVLETGQPLEIVRKGKIVRIVAEEKPSRLSRLVRHECLKGDPEDLVHLDWSGEWRGNLP